MHAGGFDLHQCFPGSFVPDAISLVRQIVFYQVIFPGHGLNYAQAKKIRRSYKFSFPDVDNQLTGFQMSNFDGVTETTFYDNSGVEYGTGIFEISINPTVTASAIIIRRADILTLCEVEVYGSKY